MRVQIVGGLAARLAAGAHGALGRGAKIEYAAEPKAALAAAARGERADLYFIESSPALAATIAEIRDLGIAAPVIACGYTDAATEAALNAGAQAYLTPQSAPDAFSEAFERALWPSPEFIARDPKTLELLALVDRVARSDASVLVTGESGVGKEAIAQRLHRLSPRGRRAMVCVNCAAIPETLLESELFGHERGAFTGAVARRIGKFEEADGSTLLLDEISEMEPRLQAKLLRALQERLIDRVGGAKPQRVDVRVIATSNRDLAAAVQRGAFRDDLYFRLNVVAITVPPLRERPLDAVALAEHFAEMFADANDLPRRPLSAHAIAAVRTGQWPGNVRELENAVQRAVLLSEGPEIDIEIDHHIDLGAAPGALARPADHDEQAEPQPLAQIERRHILEALAYYGGNRAKTAEQLGISVRTLRNKLRAYGAASPAPEKATALRAAAL